MLVMERKQYESIMIGDDIEVTVVNIKSLNAVRVGVNAPRSMPVHCREIYDAIKKQAEMND